MSSYHFLGICLFLFLIIWSLIGLQNRTERSFIEQRKRRRSHSKKFDTLH